MSAHFTIEAMRRVMRDVLRWRAGRQHSGYEKMLLGLNPFVIPWDCYVLRYGPESEILPHKDQVRGKRHYRLNVVLREAECGGVFECEHVLFGTRRIKLFRPDIHTHQVSRIEQGRRYVLSVGWVLPPGFGKKTQ